MFVTKWTQVKRIGLVLTTGFMLSGALTTVQTTAAQTNKTMLLGVIGINSAAARGVELAAHRFNARGNTVTPDGTAYQIGVKAIDATTADEVRDAVNQFKQDGAVAVFGPDRDDLAAASVGVLQGAGLPIYTASASTSVATGGLLFRTRADNTRQLTNLSQFVAGDLAKSRIALFQGDSLSAQEVTLFVNALGQQGKTPVTTVLQVAGGALKDSAKVLLDAKPDTVVVFGSDDQAVQLLRELRGQNYTGLYVYPHADSRAFIDATPDALRAGIVGVTNWAYSSETAVSAQFVRDYVALFGVAPTAESAAAYDSAGAVIIGASRNGITPDGLSKGVLALPRVESIQGHFNAALGGNQLSADVTVFTTGEYGAIVPSAQFDETGRVASSGSSPIVSVPPTAAPQAPFTQATAVGQPAATAVPQGATLTVPSTTVNVRSGPGLNYSILGRIKFNDVVPIIGISPDANWYVINFLNGQGWVLGSVVTVTGSLTGIPIVNPPPSPTPQPATLTPTAQPYINLVGLTYVVNPPSPKSGQPFTVSIVIQNQSTIDAGAFAVATSFLPGSVYSAQNLPGLAANATTTVNLTATVTGPGTYTVEVVLDLNNQLNLGPNRGHNKFPVTYTVSS
jgi:ABC-type branched-subunit amino acid transport system substrate-binding protein